MLTNYLFALEEAYFMCRFSQKLFKYPSKRQLGNGVNLISDFTLIRLHTNGLTNLAGSGSGHRAQRQQQQSTLSYPIEDYVHPSTRSVHDLKASFAWNSMLGEKDFVAAPVQAFKHVSFTRILQS